MVKTTITFGEIKDNNLFELLENLEKDTDKKIKRKDFLSDCSIEHYTYYGEFPRTEKFCKEKGIAFDRSNSGSSDTLPELYQYRPKKGKYQKSDESYSFVTDHDGNKLINANEIEGLLGLPSEELKDRLEDLLGTNVYALEDLIVKEKI